MANNAKKGSQKVMVAQWADAREKSKKVPLHKGFKKLLQDERDKEIFRVRCMHKLRSGEQCSLPANTGKLLCTTHYKGTGNKARNKAVVDRTVSKLAESNRVRESTFLKHELSKVSNIPEEELSDIKRDIQVSEAIIEKLLNQKVRTVKKGEKYSGKKLDTKVNVDVVNERLKVKAAKSLQYALANNADIKEKYFKVKFSDSNMVSKALYKYTVNMINQIIIDEVKDIDTIGRIGKRIRQLGLDIQAGQIKVG